MVNFPAKYRPDIDGLRAVAVLAVVLFHAGWVAFEGGYVGVDVFFVISGFLITQLLMKDLENDSFSIAKFYERRIRRIFPAFFALAIFVIIAATFLYNQKNFFELTQSVAAAALSWANIFFLNQAGYWDSPSLLKPMLHTWSLSVEEQFYVAYPLTLYLIVRFWKNKTTSILWVLICLSLGFNVFVLRDNPDSAFYLSYLRAWELLLGGIIAIRPLKLSQKANQLASLFGLGMILYAIFFFDSQTAFPGFMAVIPVFGSVLIINSGVSSETWVGRMLSFNPMVFIGKISYSLYLWHWPMLVFGKYYLIREANNLELAVLVGASFVMAVLSWRFVEKPFRNAFFLNRRQLFAFAGIVSLALVGVNLINTRFDGFPQRYAGKIIVPPAEFNSGLETWLSCQRIGKPFCELGVKNDHPTFFFFGDSHALALAPGMDVAAKNYQYSGYFAYFDSCLPFLGVDKFSSGVKESPKCDFQRQKVLNTIHENKDITKVIISARWATNFLGSSYKTEAPKKVITLASQDQKYADLTQAQVFYNGLRNMVAALNSDGKEIYIILSIPEVGYNVPSALFIGNLTGRDVNKIIAPTKKEYLDRNQDLIAVMQKIQLEFPGVSLIDPASLLCKDNQVCIVTANNSPLYRDDDHLSVYGSKFISSVFNEIFEK